MPPPVQFRAGMLVHPGVGEGDLGEVGLVHVAEPGREGQVVRAPVARLGEGGIAGLGLFHGLIGTRGEDVEGRSSHDPAGESGPMVRETVVDGIDGRIAAVADDQDAVPGLPGHVQARSAVGNGEARAGAGIFRQGDADGHDRTSLVWLVLFIDASGQHHQRNRQRE